MPALFDAKSYRSSKMLVAMDAVGDAAWTLWSRAILWSNEEATDGFVPTAQLRHLTHHADPVAVAEALCDAGAALRKSGLFERTDGGYLIHDFAEHNFTKAQRDEKRRRDRERKGMAKPFHADSTRNGDGGASDQRATGDGTVRDARATNGGSATDPSSVRGDSRSKEKNREEKERTAEARAGAPAAAPTSDLAEEILKVSAGHHRLAPLVDAEFANELACVATTAGKPHLVAQALEEAAGEIAAQSVTDHGKARSLVLRYVRAARPAKGSSSASGGRHGAPGREEPHNPFGPPTDEELRAHGVIQ